MDHYKVRYYQQNVYRVRYLLIEVFIASNITQQNLYTVRDHSSELLQGEITLNRTLIRPDDTQQNLYSVKQNSIKSSYAQYMYKALLSVILKGIVDFQHNAHLSLFTALTHLSSKQRVHMYKGSVGYTPIEEGVSIEEFTPHRTCYQLKRGQLV